MKSGGKIANRVFEPAMLWRLPAGLSGVALLTLPCAFLISGYESGSFMRDGLAHLLALGACSCFLGLGLGLWVGVRIRTRPAVLSAIAAVGVAIAWWQVVFQPMINGR